MTEDIIRQDIYELISKAVEDGLAIVREHETNGKLIYRYFDFPIMRHFPSGFPSFSKSYLTDDAPLNYRSVFGGKGYPPENIPSWQEFWDFAHEDKHLSRFWSIGDYIKDMWHNPDADLIRIHSEISVYGSIEKLIDRYIHVSDKKEMDESLFRPIYIEWERAIFLGELPINIVIPILCVMFSFEKLDITTDISIEKMDDTFQLARNNRSTYTVSTHETVIGTATHALILKEWVVNNNNILNQRHRILNDIRTYSSAIREIENFFAAFRSETAVETGYSQIIITPIGWADSWQAYLPPVDVVTVRAYPEHFEKHIWLEKPPVLEEETCKKVAEIYIKLREAKDNRLILAARRLNSALLRTNEEDSILDITMGLEALLTSDTRTEITYKLAVRAAALSTIEKFEELSTEDVLNHCIKIYDYRSSVIHGSKRAKKKRVIKLDDEQEISTVRLGVDILRCVFKAFCRHMQYLDLKKLDKLLVTREQSGA